MDVDVLGRLYVWLVWHNACPCAIGRRYYVFRPQLGRVCDWLERRYLWLDNQAALEEAEARLHGAAIVDELAADLRRLSEDD